MRSWGRMSEETQAVIPDDGITWTLLEDTSTSSNVHRVISTAQAQAHYKHVGDAGWRKRWVGRDCS